MEKIALHAGDGDIARAPMTVVVMPRQYSLMLYDKPGSINYCASCNVFVYGDRGFIYTINGSKVYTALAQPGMLDTVCKSMGVRSLEGYVGAAHARLINLLLRRVADVEITGRGDMAGNEMLWVKVSPK